MNQRPKDTERGDNMKIVGTNISMIRGDSESLTVSLFNAEGDKINFEQDDTLYFTIKDNINTPNKILQKIITIFDDEGDAAIEILPADTGELKYKEYVYDIQLNRADGSVKTIIPPSKFKIEGEVTYE